MTSEKIRKRVTESPRETTERVGIPAVSVRKIINTLAKYSKHDMPTPICNGQNCDLSHHFEMIGCPYDLMMELFGDLPMLGKAQIVDMKGDIHFSGHSDFDMRKGANTRKS